MIVNKSPDELYKYLLLKRSAPHPDETDTRSLLISYIYSPTKVSFETSDRFSMAVAESGLSLLCERLLGLVRTEGSLEEGHVIVMLEALDQLWSRFLGDRFEGGSEIWRSEPSPIVSMTLPELIERLQGAPRNLPSSVQEWRRKIFLDRAAHVAVLVERNLEVYEKLRLPLPLKMLETLLQGPEWRAFLGWVSRLSFDPHALDLDFATFKSMYLAIRQLFSEIADIDSLPLDEVLG